MEKFIFLCSEDSIKRTHTAVALTKRLQIFQIEHIATLLIAFKPLIIVAASHSWICLHKS